MLIGVHLIMTVLIEATHIDFLLNDWQIPLNKKRRGICTRWTLYCFVSVQRLSSESSDFLFPIFLSA